MNPQIPELQKADLPIATGSLPVQTSESGDRVTRHGFTLRRKRLADGRWGKWTVRIRFRKAVHQLTLAETAKDSFDQAIRARREIHAGRWTELKTATAFRQTDHGTLKTLFEQYRAFKGPGRPSDDTRDLNINALTAIVRDVLHPSPAAAGGTDFNVENISLLRLNADLVWKWKEQRRQLAAAAGNDERATQILRSANSRLRQARSLFTENEDLRTFYRNNKITLPDSIITFCKEPVFSDCSKDEYHAPSDEIIAATFAALDSLVGRTCRSATAGADPVGPRCAADEPTLEQQLNLNMYLACWLALGFGLRKSEIAAAKNSWFVEIDGAIYCRGDELAKNKKFPEVRVQLNAWDKLRPYIEGKDLAAHVLAGHATDRGENTFRRISDWMRGLGWQTTHHIHELRAWAGCQIAMAPGHSLREAQIFMRHASYGTTEKYYGHHLKIKLAEVNLTIPQIKPKTFNPTILPAASA